MMERESADNVVTIDKFHSKSTEFLKRRLADAILKNDVPTIKRLAAQLDQVMNPPAHEDVVDRIARSFKWP